MSTKVQFKNRAQAGQLLAAEVRSTLRALGESATPLVLALPRGGVPVAYEVARALNADLDIFLVRKIGVPGHEELAMGAIAAGGVRVLNDEVISQLGISQESIDRVAVREQAEMRRRERAYRDDRPSLSPKGRTAILVDDGIATGASMQAAAL